MRIKSVDISALELGLVCGKNCLGVCCGGFFLAGLRDLNLRSFDTGVLCHLLLCDYKNKCSKCLLSLLSKKRCSSCCGIQRYHGDHFVIYRARFKWRIIAGLVVRICTRIRLCDVKYKQLQFC